MGKCKLLDDGGEEVRNGHSFCKTLIGTEKYGFLSSRLINLCHTLRCSTVIPREWHNIAKLIRACFHTPHSQGKVSCKGNGKTDTRSGSPQLWVSSSMLIHSLIVHASILSRPLRDCWWPLMTGLSASRVGTQYCNPTALMFLVTQESSRQGESSW